MEDTLKQTISTHPEFRNKLINGKLHCDKCGGVFIEIHTCFVVMVEEPECLMCYPCNYIRTGINPHTEAINQRIEIVAKLKELRSSSVIIPRKKTKKQIKNEIPKLF